ncbi:translesion DNA synthesis-associated protein ImuA [Solimonas soli]|uniref:translesion DNA synthesis-associated protein ImuA n=1 Tax=Solimonas soli TaxID=413479 RepID=UPI0004AD3939|nr:translesion DNA synthesis-associated protein ImuA [Solimonas soli]
MSARAQALHDLLRDARLWRGDGQAPLRAEPTGHASLDALLPGGGWPCAALSEIVYAAPGVGELQLAMPLLARLARGRRRLAMIAPPYVPYAPALAQHGLDAQALVVVDAGRESDALWAAEELLRAQAGAVLLWQDAIAPTAQRRLQLAAETGDGFALVYRRATTRDAAGASASVASLRLGIARERGVSRVDVLKCRGARPTRSCALGA